MILRAALAAMGLLVPSTVAPATVEQTVISPDAIVQVICPTTGGYFAGTAFRVGPTGITLSVNHVTKTGTCLIDGKRVKLSYSSPDKDFSMIDGDRGPYLGIDCGGFIKGRHYIAIGYARGLPFQTTVEMIGTGQKSGQFSILVGLWTVIPGMSGGPIVDAETGRVVGTTNVYNFEGGWSGSLALADTPVCRSKSDA